MGVGGSPINRQVDRQAERETKANREIGRDTLIRETQREQCDLPGTFTALSQNGPLIRLRKSPKKWEREHYNWSSPVALAL